MRSLSVAGRRGVLASVLDAQLRRVVRWQFAPHDAQPETRLNQRARASLRRREDGHARRRGRRG